MLPVPGASAVVGFSEEMAKSKNHTRHNQSQKWHKNSIKPLSQRYKFLKGKFLRNLCFAKKYKKKSLKKMLANNTMC